MFENATINEILNRFDVEKETGLSLDEVEKRKNKYGLNKLKEKEKKSFFSIFISQFNDPMIFILLIAALLSIVVSIYSVLSPNIVLDDKPTVIEIIADPAIILIVCLLNAVIGTVQEINAEK